MEILKFLTPNFKVLGFRFQVSGVRKRKIEAETIVTAILQYSITP
jgi:hypothetical protein